MYGGENGGCHIRQMAHLTDHAVVNSHVRGGKVAGMWLMVHTLYALVLRVRLIVMDMENETRSMGKNTASSTLDANTLLLFLLPMNDNQ